jgi:type I restriction enzyme S subunit
MAGGFSLQVNGIRVRTSEALYQACRFPHLPELQSLIIEQRSPMTAKMKGKPHQQNSRPDWNRVRVRVMRWCLRVKLAQNWRSFSELLMKTGVHPIVEESRKDAFWGAKPVDDRTLVGMNVLGRLLMELREAVKVESRDSLLRVDPLVIPDFLLGGQPIETVTALDSQPTARKGMTTGHASHGDVGSRGGIQSSLFTTARKNEPVHLVSPSVSASSVRVDDLEPYPEYSDSGLPWLGKVPGHWEQRRMKFLFKERVQRGFPNEPLLAATQSKGVVRKEDYGARTVSAMKDLHLLKLVEHGDFVISLRSFQGGIELSHSRGIISSAYTILSPQKEARHGYYARLFKSPGFISSLTLFVTGIREGQNIDYERLSRAYLPLPPAEEQKAIGRFLEWANGRLERTIRAKRKVIALLNEQKEAIIHRAVTRGLDTSVPLKSSGIPSLGDVPEHWEIRSFVRCITERADYRGATPEKVETGVFLVTAKNIRKGWIDYETSKEYVRTSEYAKIMRRGLPKEGDVLLTMEAPLGHFALIDREDIALAQRIVRFRLNPAWLMPQFAVLCLNSPYFQDQLRERATGSTAQGIKASKLSQLLVALPNVREQQKIVEHAGHECDPIDTVISRLEREIEILREYRTRLVADVVAGKLDVREAAARLPDEAAPDTVEDDPDVSDDAEAADEMASV